MSPAAAPSRRALLALFAAALAARALFVWLAPRELSGDAIYYNAYARGIAAGWGYVNVDSSPGIRWMPGWPALLAALYGPFGARPLWGMLANAALGAGAAVLVARLGALWFGARAGIAAGALYAVWPGLVYYSATLFTETAFGFAWAGALLLLARGALAGSRRVAWFAAAGAALGLCAWIKAEPLAALPAALLVVASVRRTPGEFARAGAALVLCAVLVILPWSVRNHRVFGRFIPTSANGGAVVWLGNHPGASGGNDLASASWYAKRHAREDSAQSVIARNETGWRDAGRFVREHPGEALALVLRKQWLTYRGDDDGARLVRGLGPASEWHLSERAASRLETVANAWWLAMLALAAVGAAGARRWPPGARPLLFGVLATWVALHAVFLGGTRFHVPEIPVLAVLAGCGAETLRRRLSARTAD